MKKATIAKLLVVCLIVGMMGMSIAAAPRAEDTWEYANDVYTLNLSADKTIDGTLDGTYKVNANTNKLTANVTVTKGSTLEVAYKIGDDVKVLYSVKGEATLANLLAHKASDSAYDISGSVTLKTGAEFKYLTSLGELTVKDSRGNIKPTIDGDYSVYKGRSTGGGSSSGGSSTPVKPTDPEPTKPVFTDVAADAYYADAVAWAIEKGITVGLTETTFGPDASCTRGQMVTFLWRLAGSPKATSTNPFGDVSADSYYYDAVMWAVDKGITSGTAADAFSPDATVNRAQSVTFLYRYAGSPAVEGSNAFTDVAADDYYANAVAWAAANGITVGTTDTTFSPDDACVRGQIVTFMYRYAVEK